MPLWLIVVLVILLLGGVGSAPQFGYHSAGYYPSGGFGFVLLVLLILFLMGRL